MSFASDTLELCQNITRQRRHLVIFLLGISSGLPAALIAGTLQAWLTESGIDLKTIGWASLLVLPTTLRFFWAPIFDHYKIPFLDRRRGWLLVTQVLLILLLGYTATLSPLTLIKIFHLTFPYILLVSLLTAIISTSQDIIINAYQTEILPQEERGLGAAIYVTGWRVGVIISGALALVMASKWGWQNTYLFMASLMSIGIIATCIAPNAPYNTDQAKNFFYALVVPVHDFFQRYGTRTAILFLLIILSYKLGEALALALNSTFLLRQMGYSLALVGMVNKTMSVFSALFGGILAGALMMRMSMYRALVIFGIIQGTANLSFALMSYWGKTLFLLFFTAFTENFCSGMGTIALLAFIMSICNVKHTATQFALFTAMAFLGRGLIGPAAPYLVEYFGWTQFFIITFLISLPTIGFILLAKKELI